jgi:dipeptidyl aminopeptidase/acylaminoacyl peptidase
VTGIRQDAWAELTSEQWAEVKRLFMGAARPSCWISRIAKLLDPIAENQAATLTGLESPDGNSLLSSRGLRRDSALYIRDWKTRKAEFLPWSEMVSRAAWSPDPRYIAATNVAGSQIRLFDFQVLEDAKSHNVLGHASAHRRAPSRRAHTP